MAIENPFPDPTAERHGNFFETLESLTDEELRTYVKHLRWEQSHGTFGVANVYLSRSYYCYRTNMRIQWIREILAARKLKPF